VDVSKPQLEESLDTGGAAASGGAEPLAPLRASGDGVLVQSESSDIDVSGTSEYSSGDAVHAFSLAPCGPLASLPPLHADFASISFYFGHTLESAFAYVYGCSLPVPPAVRAMTDACPTVLCLHSNNPNTTQQLAQCTEGFQRIGMAVVAIDGFDAELTQACIPTWCRARIAWTFFGAPQMARAVLLNGVPPDAWLLICEDSCKLFSHVERSHFENVVSEAELASSHDAIWLGYRFLAKGKSGPYTVWKFGTASSLQPTSEHIKLRKPVGSKLFLMRARMLVTLVYFLRISEISYFDASMMTLRASGVLALATTPLAGSCRHYSLVDGGKFQEEQMPAGTG